MSGIFKGDSIYKSGGGGGGYKDGGALVDGDFIKVENNSVSSYDNTTRSDINFYIEIKNGEIANSVIELTTTLNATIHVYIVQNGLFIPLGNIGGDTINAGDDYNLNIVGNSFILEVVTPNGVDPEYTLLDGSIYAVKKINGLYWLKTNYVGQRGNYKEENGTRYYQFDAFKNLSINGWRLPSRDEVNSLKTAISPDPGKKLKSDSGWYDGGNGTNETELNFVPYGYASDLNQPISQYTRQARFFATYNESKYAYFTLTYNADTLAEANPNIGTNWACNIRFVHDV